jgi:TPP-dependent indolepyruvate ferredoxin oxidoreductase alpha subunit
MGYALSRFCGAWIGFKLIPETIETSATIDADINRVHITLPDFEFPAEGVNAFLTDSVYEQEARIKRYRLPAALAFARPTRSTMSVTTVRMPKSALFPWAKAGAIRCKPFKTWVSMPKALLI